MDTLYDILMFLHQSVAKTQHKVIRLCHVLFFYQQGCPKQLMWRIASDELYIANDALGALSDQLLF